MIRLSVKTLAKYMTASPASQRQILREAKFPNEDEPYAMRLYYREASERIAAYHRNKHEAEWLLKKAEDLVNLATLTGGPSGARLRHNGRALRQYNQHFSLRRFVVQTGCRLKLDIGDVRISIVPDLTVTEGGKEKLVRLDFSNSTPSSDLIKIVSQATYEAARGHVSNLTNTSVLYLDVPRGIEYKGARAGARTIREIEAACATISTVWDSIQPSRR